MLSFSWGEMGSLQDCLEVGNDEVIIVRGVMDVILRIAVLHLISPWLEIEQKSIFNLFIL